MQIIYKGKGVCATRIGHVAIGYSIVENNHVLYIPRRIYKVSIVSTKRVKHFQSFRHHKSTFYQYEVPMFSDWFNFHVYSKSMMYTDVCRNGILFRQWQKVSMWKTLCDQLLLFFIG